MWLSIYLCAIVHFIYIFAVSLKQFIALRCTPQFFSTVPFLPSQGPQLIAHDVEKIRGTSRAQAMLSLNTLCIVLCVVYRLFHIYQARNSK